MKNKAWTRDELILALDTYFDIQPATPDPGLQEIETLSGVLKNLREDVGEYRADNYRSVSSVVMKLMNFRSLDPDYHGAGLRSVGRLDREVWADFSDDRDRLRATVAAIREADVDGLWLEGQTGLDINEVYEASEGRRLSRMHVVRERSRKLVERKKARVLAEQGCLQCEVCSFEFEKVYGDCGRGFIECHHIKPLHSLTRSRKTRIDDLALVCSNCHRMIHAQRPWLSIKELREIFQGNKANVD